MNTTTRTAITAAEANNGDMLRTFQHGTIYVEDVVVAGSVVTITTTYGLVWRTTADQLVSRITF